MYKDQVDCKFNSDVYRMLPWNPTSNVFLSPVRVCFKGFTMLSAFSKKSLTGLMRMLVTLASFIKSLKEV